MKYFPAGILFLQGGDFVVKGISRQVIVVHSPDPKLFEQAIFILNNDAVSKDGITDEMLLKEAKGLIAGHSTAAKYNKYFYAGPLWACGGAILTGIAWLLTVLF